MNEMDLLERLGADVRPDPTSLLRARRRLLRHALAPASRRRRSLRVAAGLVACSAAVIAAVRSTPGPQGAAPAAAAVLTRAAALQERAPEPGPGEYRYVRVVTTRWKTEGRSTTTDEHWVPSDAGADMVTRWEGGELSSSRVRPAAIYTRPRLSVADVLDWLRRPSGDLRGTEAAYERAGAAMFDPSAPPAFKGLMLEAISRLDGVEVLDESVEFHGHTSTVIGLDKPLYAQFVFDQDTGAFLGVQASNSDGTPSYSTVISDRVAAHLPARARTPQPVP